MSKRISLKEARDLAMKTMLDAERDRMKEQRPFQSTCPTCGINIDVEGDPDLVARIRELEAEVERLKAANADALKRLTSSASIADRNRLLRAQRDRLREAAKLALEHFGKGWNIAGAMVGIADALAACEEKPFEKS